MFLPFPIIFLIILFLAVAPVNSTRRSQHVITTEPQQFSSSSQSQLPPNQTYQLPDNLSMLGETHPSHISTPYSEAVRNTAPSSSSTQLPQYHQDSNHPLSHSSAHLPVDPVQIYEHNQSAEHPPIFPIYSTGKRKLEETLVPQKASSSAQLPQHRQGLQYPQSPPPMSNFYTQHQPDSPHQSYQSLDYPQGYEIPSHHVSPDWDWNDIFSEDFQPDTMPAVSEHGSPEFAHQEQIGKSSASYGQMSKSGMINFGAHDSVSGAIAAGQFTFGTPPPSGQNRLGPNLKKHPTAKALKERQRRQKTNRQAYETYRGYILWLEHLLLKHRKEIRKKLAGKGIPILKSFHNYINSAIGNQQTERQRFFDLKKAEYALSQMLPKLETRKMRLAGEDLILAAQKYKQILQQNYLGPCGIEWKPPPNYMDIIRQEQLQKDDEKDDESESEELQKKKKKQKTK